jgi:DNA-binding transcriptional MerR regulator
MHVFTIRDLENLSGIKAHTLRIWEQRYTFIKPLRTETNIRFYTEKELRKILHVSLLNKYGYKISHIDRMTEPELQERVTTLSSSEAQQERVVNDLMLHMIEMNIDAFEELIDQHFHLKGVDKTIIQVIFPFLNKIGILWLTNHIRPAQEHLVTNIIRQKLIVGIESAMTRIQLENSVILFLPEGEYHELGLLYVCYLLKTRGVKVIYLGANVPVKDVLFVAESKKITNLYTHLTSITGNFNFDKFIKQLTQDFPGKNVVISGQLAQNHVKKIPGNVKFIRSLAEVYEYVANL